MRECNLPQEERHGGEEGSPKDRQESSSIDSNQERVIIGTGGRGGGSQGQRSKWHPCQRLLRGLEVQGQEAPRLLVSQEPQPQSVGVGRGGGEGCITGQIPAEQRGVKDERAQSVGMKLTPCWWREKARWGSSWRRRKRHHNAEGNF